MVSAPIATAAEILRYMGEVIDENGIDQHIRYGHKILNANWSIKAKDRHSLNFRLSNVAFPKHLAVGIEADGTIKGCPSLPTAAWAGGNVRDASLQDIWERAAPLRYTRDRTVDDLWGFCRTCYYADVCRAGCTRTSDVFFGKPGNNPYCHHRALEFSAKGQRERLVRVDAAPGQPFDHGRFELQVESISISNEA